MKRIIVLVMLTLVLFCFCEGAFACSVHGADYDVVDMYSTSYWAKNATYHYMRACRIGAFRRKAAYKHECVHTRPHGKVPTEKCGHASTGKR